MTRVGFVGAGRMGFPMVRRLVEAGHEVRVLVRTPEKRDAVVKSGARPVTGLTEVADGADAVIVCVFTDEEVRQLCLESDLTAAISPGAVLVIHTTCSPRTAESIAARGIDVVDAPVSGGPHDIAAGRLTLFVGGHDQSVAQVRPVLGAYGDPILHVGVTGAGQLTKLINNALFAAQVGLAAEAARLGGMFGVSESAVLNALTRGSASSRALSLAARAGSAAEFVDAVGDFIVKDVAVVRETLAGLGGELGVLDDLVGIGLGIRHRD
jgi:3-hydroxyisobutyrate dehydrogenase-like beta-hydroxyacid dehydrogenase